METGRCWLAGIILALIGGYFHLSEPLSFLSSSDLFNLINDAPLIEKSALFRLGLLFPLDIRGLIRVGYMGFADDVCSNEEKYDGGNRWNVEGNDQEQAERKPGTDEQSVPGQKTWEGQKQGHEQCNEREWPADMRRREVSQSYERKCRFRKMRPRHRHEERKSGNPGERCVSFPRFHSFVHNALLKGGASFTPSLAAEGYAIFWYVLNKRKIKYTKAPKYLKQ